MKGLLRQKSHLLIPRTNYCGLLFSQESHPLRMHIAFPEHISLLRVSLVGISYCSAVTYPAGLLLLGCTGEKRGKLLQLTKMLCPNYDSYIEEQRSTPVLTMGKHAFAKYALLVIQDKQ